MVPNVCIHHAHGPLVYDHLHNSTSVHMSKNCMPIEFELIISMELPKFKLKGAIPSISNHLGAFLVSLYDEKKKKHFGS